MENNDRQELELEYCQRFSRIKYWVIRYTGYSRFNIENNHIVEKSWNSVLYGACVIVIMALALLHIVYELTVRVQYLLQTELVILLQISSIIFLFVVNTTFFSKDTGVKIVNHSIDIDVLLGIKETKFMRDIVETSYTLMGIPVIIVQILLDIFLYLLFEVSALVYVSGALYFSWMIVVFYDINYLLAHSSFVTLRTKYLNVALMRSLNVKTEYIPDLYFFNGLFWKTRHNDLVMFHNKADVKQYVNAYKMLFKFMHILEECYRFYILTGIMCVTIGSFISVQTMILYGNAEINILRKSIIVGWLVVSWVFLFSLSFQLDTFSRQIDQTKLICAYAQMKYITNERVYQFTKAVLRAIEIRVTGTSIYGLFFIDPGVILKIAASTFVYLTAQLQINLSLTDEKIDLNNATTTAITSGD